MSPQIQNAEIETDEATTSTEEKPPAIPRDLHAGFSLIDTCKFKIHTVEQAAALSRFSAAMFRDPVRLEPGLYALMLNAVEHGCLEIGYDLKSRLLADGNWQTEIQRRQSLPENREKTVEVVIARRAEGVFIVITDPGSGFDWKSWINIDPARARDTHGRGIARARGVSFDSLAYNAAGNQVALHVRDVAPAKW
ncbi:MAG: ATP-binding protein [Alphaproteobacteria bacterium]